MTDDGPGAALTTYMLTFIQAPRVRTRGDVVYTSKLESKLTSGWQKLTRRGICAHGRAPRTAIAEQAIDPVRQVICCKPRRLQTGIGIAVGLCTSVHAGSTTEASTAGMNQRLACAQQSRGVSCTCARSALQRTSAYSTISLMMLWTVPQEHYYIGDSGSRP